jgi:hypothetical protein
VIQLYPDAAAVVSDRQIGIEPPVLDAQVIEVTQGLAGKIAKLRVMALGLELGNHHHRQDDPVLGEPADGGRVGQQDAGVQDVRPALPAG